MTERLPPLRFKSREIADVSPSSVVAAGNTVPITSPTSRCVS